MSKEDLPRTPPSDEALRRYPNSYGYNYQRNPEGEACTCAIACVGRCAGECGCHACADQFADFCDVAGFSGTPEVWTKEREREAKLAYSGTCTLKL